MKRGSFALGEKLRYLFRPASNTNRGTPAFGAPGAPQRARPDADPDFERMTDAEICAFFAALVPDATEAELAAIDRDVSSGLSARLRGSDAGKRRTKRRGWAVAVVCALLAAGLMAQAAGVPLWRTVARWTQENLIMDYFPSPALQEAQPRRRSLSEAERQTWGEEVCEALAEFDWVPKLPTWKPEGFKLAGVFVDAQLLIGSLVGAAYRSDDGKTMMLYVQELPTQWDHSISYESNEGSEEIVERDGVTYYYFQNMDRSVVVWQDGGVSLDISAEVDRETLRRMIDSLPEE